MKTHVFITGASKGKGREANMKQIGIHNHPVRLMIEVSTLNALRF